MRRTPVGFLAVLVAASISGCVLISAAGVYNFRNETSQSVRVSWNELAKGDTHTTGWIPPGRTVRLTTHRLLEADSVPPSQCFETFRLEVDVSDDWETIYEHSDSPEDFDAAWEREQSGYRRHTYTFVLTTP